MAYGVGYENYGATNYGDYLPAAGFTTPRACAMVVIGALVLLWMIRRGFRGVNLGGVSVGVR